MIREELHLVGGGCRENSLTAGIYIAAAVLHSTVSQPFEGRVEKYCLQG